MRRSGKRRFFVLSAALAAAALSAQPASEATTRQPEIPNRSLPRLRAAPQRAAAEAPPPVLVDGLGYAGIEPDSDNAEARAWFAQGVRLIWAFDEAEAIRAFREAQRLDPSCALVLLRRGLGARADDQPAAAHRGAGRRARRRPPRARIVGRA